MFKSKQKIFVIGRNKTGTTSVGAALRQAGYNVAPQEPAELMLSDWEKRDFRRIVKFCQKYEVFQDIPFSLAYTYQILDYVFPGSKFILTVRDSSEQWFESVTRFHTKIIAKNRLPTVDDLKEFPYIYKGWLWAAEQAVYGVNENTLYNRLVYVDQYESHNNQVREYFRRRKGDLLVINLTESNAGEKLGLFLRHKSSIEMPHLNKST